MIAVRGGLNFWSKDEYDNRLKEAEALAVKRFPVSLKWQARVIKLSEGFSDRNWAMFQEMGVIELKRTMVALMDLGMPLDAPLEGKNK